MKIAGPRAGRFLVALIMLALVACACSPAAKDSAGGGMGSFAAAVSYVASHESAGGETMAALEPGTALYEGDRVKAVISANRGCHAYLLTINAGGEITLLFPDPGAGLDNPLRAEQSRQVSSAARAREPGDVTGITRIFFIASIRPLAELETRLARLQAEGEASIAKEINSELTNLFGSRGPGSPNDAFDPRGVNGYNLRAIGDPGSGPEMTITAADGTQRQFPSIVLVGPDLLALELVFERKGQRDHM